MSRPDPLPTVPTSDQEEDASFYRDVLHELVTMGMDLARAVHQHAQVHPTPDEIAAFDRISRAVRRTVLLARSLDEAPRRPTRAEARAAIIRRVEDRIATSADRSEAEPLRAEFHERLDSPDLEDDLGRRPVADIIQEICNDLGLDAMPEWGIPPMHQRRTPRDVARVLQRAAQPSISTAAALQPKLE